MDPAHCSDEPSEYVSLHEGVIHYEWGHGHKSLRAGRLRAYRIPAGLAADGDEPLLDVCNSHCAEVHDTHSLLYAPAGFGFKDCLVHRFDTIEADCLVIDYVVLHPRWLGLRLGLLAVRETADIVGDGCDLAGSDIAPSNLHLALCKFDAADKCAAARH
jgi:hypothetical protein